MTLTEFAADRIAEATSKGVHQHDKNKALTADAIYSQQGACWLCGDPLDDTVQLDRLVTGRNLGLDCRCADHCRCAYLAGNVGAAHKNCHVGTDSPREALTERELIDLATRYMPTADGMAAARVDRRADRGRAASPNAARVAQAKRRAQGA